jgi:hypothetical protein
MDFQPPYFPPPFPQQDMLGQVGGPALQPPGPARPGRRPVQRRLPPDTSLHAGAPRPGLRLRGGAARGAEVGGGWTGGPCGRAGG